MKHGVNVIQNDIETGLTAFEDNSFDFVILSQTLQAMRNAESVLNEMLRVGREGIVTFPNFGYWRHRLDILRGRMPVSRIAALQVVRHAQHPPVHGEGLRGPVRARWARRSSTSA